MLEFDEKTHIYRENGQIKPSVTQIIGEICPFPWDSEAVKQAAQFGTVLHRTLELLDNGNLSEYDHVLDPWIGAWKHFRESLDRSKFRYLIVDIKTGAQTKTWPVQLGGYYGLIKDDPKPMIEGMLFSGLYGYAGTVDRVFEGTGRGIKACDVQITDSGYKMFPADPVAEFNVFLSFLNIYKWKKLNNLLKGGSNEYD